MCQQNMTEEVPTTSNNFEESELTVSHAKQTKLIEPINSTDLGKNSGLNDQQIKMQPKIESKVR